MTPRSIPVLLAALAALSLAGCINSAKPILTGGKPVLGQHLRLQLYSLRKGFADGPEQTEYAWNGTYYAHVSGSMKDVAGFTVYSFENGDYIVQTRPDDPKDSIDYALLRPLLDGVYQAIVINEEDADAATRTANCVADRKWSCRVETRAQLWALARATAAHSKYRGGLAVRLSDERK